MKRIFVIAIAALLCCGFVSQAAAQERGGKDRKGRRAEVMKRFDKNGDGKLDQGERQALREQMKAKRAERRAQAERQGKARRPGRKGQAGEQKRRPNIRRLIVRRFDRNKDGRLGPVERRRAGRFLRRMIRGLRVTKAQKGQGRGQGEQLERPQRRRVPQGFRRFDRNKDGRIGPVERRMMRQKAIQERRKAPQKKRQAL